MKKFFKKIYSLLPFKKEIFLFLRIFPVPQFIYKHLYFKGIFNVKTDNGKFRMQHYGFELENNIFWEGIKKGWEKTTTEIWVELSKEATVVFDIGANTGIFALIAKTVNPDAQIFAFEPINRIYQKMLFNCQLNSYDIRCEQLAVSDTDGKSVIYDSSSEIVYGASLQKKFLDGASLIPTEINTIKLSTYIQKNNILKIDLMKIDVETWEPETLTGMENYLSIFQPSIIIEVLTNEVGERIEKLLPKDVYHFFYLDNNSFIKTVNHLTGRYHLNTNYLLCNRTVAKKLGLMK